MKLEIWGQKSDGKRRRHSSLLLRRIAIEASKLVIRCEGSISILEVRTTMVLIFIKVKSLHLLYSTLVTFKDTLE